MNPIISASVSASVWWNIGRWNVSVGCCYVSIERIG